MYIIDVENGETTNVVASRFELWKHISNLAMFYRCVFLYFFLLINILINVIIKEKAMIVIPIIVLFKILY